MDENTNWFGYIIGFVFVALALSLMPFVVNAINGATECPVIVEGASIDYYFLVIQDENFPITYDEKITLLSGVIETAIELRSYISEVLEINPEYYPYKIVIVNTTEDYFWYNEADAWLDALLLDADLNSALATATSVYIILIETEV